MEELYYGTYGDSPFFSAVEECNNCPRTLDYWSCHGCWAFYELFGGLTAEEWYYILECMQG